MPANFRSINFHKTADFSVKVNFRKKNFSVPHHFIKHH